MQSLKEGYLVREVLEKTIPVLKQNVVPLNIHSTTFLISMIRDIF